MLLDQVTQSGGSVSKRELDERAQQVATQLAQRGVLTRCRVKGKLIYKLCEPDIWRI